MMITTRYLEILLDDFPAGTRVRTHELIDGSIRMEVSLAGMTKGAEMPADASQSEWEAAIARLKAALTGA
jgi:hypothetical protein